MENETRGNGAEISVTVRDDSGEPVSSAVIVKLFRNGTMPSGQGETSGGTVVFVVNSLGEFTVTVEGAGYAAAQKDFSINVTGSTQIDVYVKPFALTAPAQKPPGRPILAPNAKRALDKSLQALGTDKIVDAEKFVDEAIRLAPNNPDVLYVQGVLRLKQHNWPQAQSALEEATQLAPDHARAFAALGMALCDQGKYADAIVPLEKSLQLDAAGSWETRWTLAKAYYQHQQYEDALTMSQQALANSNGKAPEIALLVAQSLTATARYNDAALLLRSFLRDHANLREAATARRWLERLTSSGKLIAQN